MVSSQAVPEADGRSTRWDAHKSRRREVLLDAAVAAIEAHGPDVGVRQIAELAGVPRSVVYRHFADRADLDEQISARIIELVTAEVAPTLRPQGTVTEAIRRIVGTYLGWIEQHPRLHTFLGARAGGSQAVHDAKAALARLAAEVLATAARAKDANPSFAPSVAAGLVGFVDATVNHWLATRGRGTVGAARLTEYLSRSIWSMLDGNARALGVVIDPDRPVRDLLED